MLLLLLCVCVIFVCVTMCMCYLNVCISVYILCARVCVCVSVYVSCVCMLHVRVCGGGEERGLPQSSLKLRQARERVESPFQPLTGVILLFTVQFTREV